MADWNQQQADFLSLYMTKSDSPERQHHNGHSDLIFSPSPVKQHKSIMDFYTGGSNVITNGTHGNTFCQMDNIDQCVSVLNQEVTSLGMPSLYEGASEDYSVPRLVNCTRDLLEKHQKSMRIREELENRTHRAETDRDHLILTQNKLKQYTEQLHKDIAQITEKERQLLNKNKLLTNKLKVEKDEVKRLQSVIKSRDAQYKHEIKKKEREFLKLKERLHQHISDRLDRRIGIEISSVLQRADGKRSTWNTPGKKHEEEMYRTVISTYEEKHKELLVENNDLRDSLSTIQKEMVALLRAPSDTSIASTDDIRNQLINLDESQDSDAGSESSKVTDDLSDAHFQMPFDMVRDPIEQSVKLKCKMLKTYIKSIQQQKSSHHHHNGTDKKSPTTKEAKHGRVLSHSREENYKKEIEKLNKQLERYREIIEEQENLLQQQLQSNNESANISLLRDSHLWEEKEALEDEKKLYEKQKSNFEGERKNFTEAAIRLAKEKKQFEDEKASFMQQQFMNMTPFRSSKHSNTPQQNNTQQFRPVSAGNNRNSCPRKRVLPSAPSPTKIPQHSSTQTPSKTHKHSTGCGERPKTAGAATDKPPVRTPSTAELYRFLGMTQPPPTECRDIGNLKEKRPIPQQTSTMAPDFVFSPVVSNTSSRRSSMNHTPANSKDSSPANSARVTEHMIQLKKTLFESQIQNNSDSDA